MTYGSPNLGLTAAILHSGHILPGSAGDPFPASHIVLALTSLLTGLPLFTISLIAPAMYFCFYTVMLWVIGKTLFSRRAAAILMALIGIPVYSTVFDVPSIAYYIPRNFYFATMFPIAILLVYKSLNRVSLTNTVLIIITFAVLPLYHSFDAFLLALASFPVLVLGHAFDLRRSRGLAALFRRPDAHFPVSYVRFTLPLLVLVMTLLVWFDRTVWFQSYVSGLTTLLQASSGLSYAASRFSALGFSLQSEVATVFFRTGSEWPYFTMGAVVSFVFFSRLLRRHAAQKRPIPVYGFLAAITFIIFFGIAAVSVLTPLSWLSGGGETRVESYLVFFAGLSVVSLFNNKPSRNSGWTKRRLLIVAALIVGLTANSALGSYSIFGSPHSLWMNMQVTKSDVVGLSWFSVYEEQSLPVFYTYMSLQDMIVAQTGNFSSLNNVPGIGDPPTHFCYNLTEFGKCISQSHYFISNTLSEEWEPVVYPTSPAHWEWSPSDYSHLLNDPSVALVYSDGGLQIYLISLT
ncbi:MAG: hypothetical protein QXV32_06660 [Conexivisphaerales archaeon]